MTEPVQTTWATVADVLDTTDTTVTNAELKMAAATIDLFAVRLYADKDRIGLRDQHWLKQAVCYQAAWLTANPDVFQRFGIESDGGSGLGAGSSSTKYATDAMTLAPFAAKALKRVSWLRSRSLHVRGAGEYCGDGEPEDAERGWSAWRPV